MSGAPASVTFETELRLVGRAATAFDVPVDLRACFGRVRPLVRVTVNGHTYRSTPGILGGRSYVVVREEARAAAGVAAGQRITVTLAADDEPLV